MTNSLTRNVHINFTFSREIEEVSSEACSKYANIHCSIGSYGCFCGASTFKWQENGNYEDTDSFENSITSFIEVCFKKNVLTNQKIYVFSAGTKAVKNTRFIQPATAPTRSLNETVAPSQPRKTDSDGSQGFSTDCSRKWTF